ncbi:TonB family protein [Psychrobacter sp. PL15]|uniref:energy transducer TonB n=1 Tax=Psychrobacter sp. PL15 TaxID=3071719 RepID=UPI002E07C757|nr:TonB family protein [Psychrobacter sp. PL15]
MGSTSFNAPSLKLILIVVGTVVALHVLTAMALVSIRPLTPVIQPAKAEPAIEIQLVTLAVETEGSEITTDAVKPTKALKPLSKPAAVLKSKAKSIPQTAKTSKPVTATKPVVKAAVKSEQKNITPKLETQANTSNVAKNEPFSQYIQQNSMTTAQADSLTAINEGKMLAAQAEKSAQEAHAKIMRDAQAAANAKVLRDDAQQIADAKAVQQVNAAKEASQAAARAKTASDAKAAATAKAAAAASNTPVSFNASNANWTAKPNFNFPDRAKRGTKSGDTFNLVLMLQVNKQGSIDSVRLAQSSGNALLDREAQRQVRSGKFRPFMKNDVPVVGNVTLPISYAVP